MSVKEKVVAELNELPAALLPEVLRFVQFIKSQTVHVTSPGANAPALVTVPPTQVAALSELVDLSGDALVDTERLYAE
ncbi:MAG: hypothetical protein M1140_06345 [Chloroflexi bacterium]|nr:hypothetical protein [Chloroflexota bacterium]